MMYPKPVRPKRKRVGVSPAQRARLLNRAGGICERCGEPFDFRGPHIHHITSRGLGGTRQKYSDEELEVLDGTCHSADHGIREC